MMAKLAMLERGNKKRSTSKFDSETMMFIPEMVNQQGVQSAVDFIKNGPVGKSIKIFSFASSESTLD